MVRLERNINAPDMRRTFFEEKIFDLETKDEQEQHVQRS